MIHPETAAKINFLTTNDFHKLQERIAADQIEAKYGGTMANQTVYWYDNMCRIIKGQS
jgi:hypothetical protein